MAETLREMYDRRFARLVNDFSTWKPVYQDLAKYILPRAGRFSLDDYNDGARRDQFILDSTGTRAARTLSAGMMAGMTSPARPWFRLVVGDSELMEYQPVKEWIHDTAERMRRIFARSNTYRSLHTMYDELGVFGTATSLVLQNYDNVIHHYPHTVGQYYLAQSALGSVDTVYREFNMSVSQLVEEFGKDNVSPTIRALYTRGSLDSPVVVRHVIEPRYDRDRMKRDKWNMPWKSCYYEKGADTEMLLREGGFEEYPALSPRWDTQGGDTYGRSPGVEALGDVMQLQHDNEIWAKGAEYQGDPPVVLPASMAGQRYDLLPGGESFYDDLGGQSRGIRSAFEVNLDLNALREGIIDKRQQINSAFYADLFTMLATSDRRQMTATEVAERHEEKLLVLGPVLERLHNEMLDPLIDRTFAIMVRTGAISPPPLELQGQELRVEYVSMLAQAQRAVGVTAVDRLLGTVGSIAQFKPEALDKLNTDEIIDGYADMLGVSPEFILAGDEVAIIRQQRAAAIQQQEQAAAAAQGAQAAKTLSETDTEGDNALTRMFTGL